MLGALVNPDALFVGMVVAVAALPLPLPLLLLCHCLCRAAASACPTARALAVLLLLLLMLTRSLLLWWLLLLLRLCICLCICRASASALVNTDTYFVGMFIAAASVSVSVPAIAQAVSRVPLIKSTTVITYSRLLPPSPVSLCYSFQSWELPGHEITRAREIGVTPIGQGHGSIPHPSSLPVFEGGCQWTKVTSTRAKFLAIVS